MTCNANLFRVKTQEMDGFRTTLVHRLTMLDDRASEEGSLRGTTVWGTTDKSAAIYWGWTLTEQGIVVLTNPLAIRSNLLFTEVNETLSLPRQVMEVNRLIHGLDWQQNVRKHLQCLKLVGQRSETYRKVATKRSTSRNADHLMLAA